MQHFEHSSGFQKYLNITRKFAILLTEATVYHQFRAVKVCKLRYLQLQH